MSFSTVSTLYTEALKKHGVYNDVIDEFKQTALIYAQYQNGDKVSLGNTLKVADTQDLPDVHLTFTNNPKGKSYTLVVTDPDAPTRGDPTWSEYAHYLVTGIKPDVGEGDIYKVDFTKTTELLPYMGPGPPAKTGLHRYVFILYEESGPVKGLPSDNRANWGTGKPGSGVRDWVKGQGLTPVGVNFFLAQNVEQ